MSDTPQDPTVDAALVEELRRIAADLALEAGRLVVDERPDRLGTATKSTPTDVVTEMDRRSEALLARRVRELRPDDGFYGEEDGRRSATTGLTWVVDPIDGTVNYLYGIPEYAVSVAVVTGDPEGDWEPVAGAVYDAGRGLLYTAAAGRGATVREPSGAERPLRVRDAVGLDQALVATGFDYSADTRRGQAAVLAEVLPLVRDIRRGGSAALDLCAVAAGRVDGYYELTVHVWDVAAGVLLVREAGGEVSGYGDAAPLRPGMVAGSPALRAELAGLVAGLHARGDEGSGAGTTRM